MTDDTTRYIECENCGECQAIFIGGVRQNRWQWECTECQHVWWCSEPPTLDDDDSEKGRP